MPEISNETLERCLQAARAAQRMVTIDQAKGRHAETVAEIESILSPTPERDAWDEAADVAFRNEFTGVMPADWTPAALSWLAAHFKATHAKLVQGVDWGRARTEFLTDGNAQPGSLLFGLRGAAFTAAKAEVLRQLGIEGGEGKPDMVRPNTPDNAEEESPSSGPGEELVAKWREDTGVTYAGAKVVEASRHDAELVRRINAAHSSQAREVERLRELLSATHDGSARTRNPNAVQMYRELGKSHGETDTMRRERDEARKELERVKGELDESDAARVENKVMFLDEYNQAESLRAQIARFKSEVEATAKSLAERSDSAYCSYIEGLRKDACLGWSAKVATGKFTRDNLKAHTDARLHLGRHQALAEARAAVRALLTAEEETPGEASVQTFAAPDDVVASSDSPTSPSPIRGLLDAAEACRNGMQCSWQNLMRVSIDLPALRTLHELNEGVIEAAGRWFGDDLSAEANSGYSPSGQAVAAALRARREFLESEGK